MINKGFRLRKIIENKYKQVKSFADVLGWSKQKLDYYLKLEDIPNKSLLPILEKLGVTYDEFIGVAKSDELQNLKKELEACRNENIQLSRELIKVQGELLKKKSGKNK